MPFEKSIDKENDGVTQPIQVTLAVMPAIYVYTIISVVVQFLGTFLFQSPCCGVTLASSILALQTAAMQHIGIIWWNVHNTRKLVEKPA